MFLCSAFEVEEILPKVEQQHKCTGKRRSSEIDMILIALKAKFWYSEDVNKYAI